MTPLELLSAARARISNRSRWHKGSYARNDLGDITVFDSAAAYSFCAVGAVYASAPAGSPDRDHPFSHLDSRGALRYLRDAVEQRVPAVAELAGTRASVRVVAWFNDNHATKHADVLAVYDAAIKAASEVAS